MGRSPVLLGKDCVQWGIGSFPFVIYKNNGPPDHGRFHLKNWKLKILKYLDSEIPLLTFTHFALFDGNGIDYERYHLKTANAKFDKSMASPIDSNGI